MIKQKQKRKDIILDVLKQADRSLNSAVITEALMARGYETSERTVRLYLQELDSEDLTENFGKQGRRITEKGLTELNDSQTLARVGFLSGKIDQMTYRMSFDLALRTGTVLVNTTLVRPDYLKKCTDKICRVFEHGYAMGQLVGLLEPGERVGDIAIPEDMLGFCSVCSITLNGVLLKHGIPTYSKFGGLMQMRNGQPVRFVEMIMYEGTSIDPLEVFIRSAMTDYLGAVSTGNGCIGASFREMPADSRDLVVNLAEKLDAVGLGGFMEIGYPGQALFDIPVNEYSIGAVVIGGLNPVAILEELGMRAFSRALAGPLDFNRLFNFQELKSHL